MSTLVTKANDAVSHFRSSETIYKLGFYGFAYTEGVREVSKKYGAYWFLDVVASYQSKLKDEEFQVWKLEREYSFTIVEDVKNVLQRKNIFYATCEDGNGNVLITQKIENSDFPFDEYIIWVQNKILYLPAEH